MGLCLRPYGPWGGRFLTSEVPRAGKGGGTRADLHCTRRGGTKRFDYRVRSQNVGAVGCDCRPATAHHPPLQPRVSPCFSRDKSPAVNHTHAIPRIGFVPQPQHVNLRKVGQPERGRARGFDERAGRAFALRWEGFDLAKGPPSAGRALTLRRDWRAEQVRRGPAERTRHRT